MMMPKFITDVTSSSTLLSSAAFCAGAVQYGQVCTGTPRAAAALAPHRANADVTPHGRPAITSVAMFTAARPIAPATSGHGPRSHRGSLVRRRQEPPVPPPLEDDRAIGDRRESGKADGQARDRTVQRDERGRPATTAAPPTIGACAVPITEPTMNKRSTTTMRAAAAAGRIERAGRAAATQLHAHAEDERPGDDRHAGRRHRPAKGLTEQTSGREQRKEHRGTWSASITICARSPAPRRSLMKTRQDEVKPKAAW